MLRFSCLFFINNLTADVMDSLHRDLSDFGWTDKSDEPDLHSGAGQAAQPSAEGVSAGGCQ